MLKMKDNLYMETKEIINALSLYKTLKYEQIIRMFPNKKEETIKNILSNLIKEKKIIYDEETSRVSYGFEPDNNPDLNLITAFWILVDFFDTVEFHYLSEYPVQISFFMDATMYEIITAEQGKETMLNNILSLQKNDPPNRIIIVDNEKQIPKIKADNIFCFCTVNKTGEIEYFNFE